MATSRTGPRRGSEYVKKYRQSRFSCTSRCHTSKFLSNPSHHPIITILIRV
jgi:hypothetical protein